MNYIVTLLTILLPLIGGAIGYLYKQGIDKKKELQSEVNKERREMYQQFVNLTIDLFIDSHLERKTQTVELISKFFEFYKKYILYASPEVINSCGAYLQCLYQQEGTKDPSITMRKLSKVWLEMRKDLSLSNEHLGRDGEKILRAIITDYDKFLK